MIEISLSDNDQRIFKKALKYSKHWCNEHQWEIGAAEMALGAAILVWGVQSGQLEVGRDFIVSKLSDHTSSGLYGATTETGLGVIGSSILGSIGVTAMGRVISIPAIALIGGGTFILSGFGYAVGDLAEKFLPPAVNLAGFVAGASILTLALALIIDGARHVVKDECYLLLGSVVAYGKIYCNELKAKVVSNTPDEFMAIITEHAQRDTNKTMI
jgi:hypothetical protein